MRKFLVRANLKKSSLEYASRARNSIGTTLEREFELFADDADDAKVRAKQLLKNEGYDEKLLHRAIWTVSRLDHPRKN